MISQHCQKAWILLVQFLEECVALRTVCFIDGEEAPKILLRHRIDEFEPSLTPSFYRSSDNVIRFPVFKMPDKSIADDDRI